MVSMLAYGVFSWLMGFSVFVRGTGEVAGYQKLCIYGTYSTTVT